MVEYTEYSMKQMKQMLISKHGGGVVLAQGGYGYGKDTVLTFKSASRRLLHHTQDEKRGTDETKVLPPI